jgi:hypothetical protein
MRRRIEAAIAMFLLVILLAGATFVSARRTDFGTMNVSVGKAGAHTDGFLQIQRRANMDTAGVGADVTSTGIPIAWDVRFTDIVATARGYIAGAIPCTVRAWSTTSTGTDVTLEWEHIFALPGVSLAVDSSFSVSSAAHKVLSFTCDCTAAHNNGLNINMRMSEQ